MTETLPGAADLAGHALRVQVRGPGLHVRTPAITCTGTYLTDLLERAGDPTMVGGVLADDRGPAAQHPCFRWTSWTALLGYTIR